MIALLINFALALIWLMLSESPTVTDFIVGYILGFLLIVPFKRLVGGGGYIRKTWGFLFFLLVYFKEFIKANLSVAYAILFIDKTHLKPRFFTYDVSKLSHFETLLLTHCITLTPGTITVDILEGEGKIIVHCFNYEDPQEIEKTLDNEFVQSIQRFTR